jgi:O-antigen/teichoic acid export membrane protein
MSDSDLLTPPVASEARTAARNAAVLTVASIVSKGAQFIWQLVLARLLAQADYGIYGTIGGMLAIAATLPEFGMGIIALRDVAQRRELAGKYLSATLVLQPLVAVLAYAGLYVAGRLLGYDAEILVLLPLAGLSLFLDMLGNMVHNQLLAREQMVATSVIGIVHIATLIILVALALLGGLGLRGLYYGTIAAGALRSLLYWIALVCAGVGTEWPLALPLARRLTANGAPIMLNSFMRMAYQHVDKIIMTATLGQAYTAYLLAAFIIVAGMVELLNTTVLVAVFPLMSRQYGTGQHDAFAFLVQKIAFLTLVLSVPIAVAISVLASPLVAVLFSPAYTAITAIVQVLVWYGVVMMVGNVFAQVMMIRNRQARLLGIRAAALVVNIALLLALLPRIGVMGVAVSSLVAECFATVLLLHQWEGNWELLRQQGPRVLRLAAAAALMGLSMATLHLAGQAASGIWRSVAPLGALAAGAIVYIAVVHVSGVIAPDDRGFIRQVLVSMPGGAFVARIWKQA